MTVWGRDASDFDSSVDFTGLGFFTHKATEGISVQHVNYGPRLAAARDAGVPVLGSYHVVRTPNAKNGSLYDQLQRWVDYQNSQTPWWRSWPHWVMQIDAEKWAYDAVSADTVKSFAQLVAGVGLPAWVVTYASRGQYGDTLTGIRTPLWNADYRGSGGGSYPGDGWVAADKGAPAGWAPYSGQTPAILQYTSTPYDKNAFRGSLDDFRQMIGGNRMAYLDDPNAAAEAWRIDALAKGTGTVQGGPVTGEEMWLVGAVKDIQSKVGQPAPVALTDEDRAAIVADLLAGMPKPPTAAEIADELAARLKD